MISTDIDFPVDLPCPLRDGYSINHVRPFRRTGMASGRTRQRRLFTSVPTNVSVSWIFYGDSQAAAFEAWFQESIHDGADWFNCTLKTPVGYQPYICRFTDMYKGPEPIGINMWKVVASLEIWERPLLPPGWGTLPEYVIHADIFDIAMNREWPEA